MAAVDGKCCDLGHEEGGYAQVEYEAEKSLEGFVVPSFRALSRHLTVTIRRHKLNEDPLTVNGTGNV